MVLLFQNFAAPKSITYDPKLGLCVGEENGRKTFGATAKETASQCGFVGGKNYSYRDLHGASLTGTTFFASQAYKINLASSHLLGVTVQKSQVSASNLSGSTIESSEFHDSDLSQTDFSNSSIQYSSFNRLLETSDDVKQPMLMRLANSVFANAKLSSVAFYSVDLTGANFQHAMFDFGSPTLSQITIRSKAYSAIFDKVVGEGADFSNSRIIGSISNSRFEHASFMSAVFNAGTLNNSSFSSSAFKNSHLNQENFCGQVSFANADLSGSDWRNLGMGQGNCRQTLTNVDMTHTNLAKSVLSFSAWSTGAKLNLENSDLRGADLSSLKNSKNMVQKISFRGAIYNVSTKLPFDDKTARALGLKKVL